MVQNSINLFLGQNAYADVKDKNRKLSKLFFLGFADKNQQRFAIKDYTAQLSKTVDILTNIKKSFSALAEQQRKFKNVKCDELLKFR